MTFVQRNRLRAALAVLLAAVSVLVLLTRLHYAPVLAQLAALQLDNQASAAELQNNATKFYFAILKPAWRKSPKGLF